MRSTAAGRAIASGALAVLLGAIGSVALAQAAVTIGEGRDDATSKPQSDAETVKPPAYPTAEDLVEFFVSAANDFEFFIDAQSIAIDGSIVRYTLVARSPEGVDNVSYEAIRCGSSEYRIYAIGHRDRTWAQRPTPWRAITPESVQRWRRALLKDYFCPGGAPIFTADEGIDALRRGRHPLIEQPNRF